jgi:hypothetical protein
MKITFAEDFKLYEELTKWKLIFSG